MPFDTTYYINAHNENINASLTLPGGKDTFIILKAWQLPSELDSALAHHDNTIRSLQNSLAKDEENAKAYNPNPFLIFTFFVVFAIVIYKAWRDAKSGRTYSETIFNDAEKPRPRSFHTYYGNELAFTGQQLSKILFQRFPYFKSLSFSGQTIFLERLQKFMADKIFKIHGEKGYKEMPVLVSAAAIQLTYGLKKYMLPHFHYIHIHPQEFLRVRPILCFLEGNVSGHSINLSWKHFLEGYANPNDGQNVGLHELAHALHYQTFVVERNIDKGFRNFFDNFNIDGNKAYHTETTVAGGLYSEYAEKNFQEFWAESVEIFFEKPADMKSHYPQLYDTMKYLLNQDPLNNIPSLGS